MRGHLMSQGHASDPSSAHVTRHIEAMRDASGTLTGVLVTEPNQADIVHPVDELRDRVNDLRGIVNRYGGRLLMAEGNLEAWTLGILGNQVTISIPSFELLLMLREPRTAGVFLSILEASERRLSEWLDKLPDAELDH